MSTKYTISDVKEADRLWDEMSHRKISEKTGIPKSTLSDWATRGLISTDTNHREGPRLYDEETVERANRMYDHMPLPDVAGVLDVPLNTLYLWNNKGWIETDRDWSANSGGPERKASIKRAVELVHGDGLTNKEAAEKLGVAPSTISRYLKQYAKRRY